MLGKDWKRYYGRGGHPPLCTCVDCTEARLGGSFDDGGAPPSRPNPPSLSGGRKGGGGQLAIALILIIAAFTGAAFLVMLALPQIGLDIFASDPEPPPVSAAQPIAAAARPTDTPTPVPTNTAAPRPVPTRAPTATPTNTPTSTNTPTAAPTDTPAPTNTPVPTSTPTPIPTSTPTATRTPTSTPLPPVCTWAQQVLIGANKKTDPCVTPTPTLRPGETRIPTHTPTPAPTDTPRPTNTPLPPTPAPTTTHTPTPAPAATDTPRPASASLPPSAPAPIATATAAPPTHTPTRPPATATPRPANTPTPIAPSPTPTQPPPTNTNTPAPTATATPPSNRDAHLRHIEEKNYMLALINAARKEAGVNPVELGDNIAAQLHAESALANCFGSHWGIDGLKPYMRYTLAGGYQSNGENFSGLDYCIKASDRYAPIASIEEDIEQTMRGLMNSPGHRRNILDKHHKKVNLGFAWDRYNFQTVQHFEGDYSEYTRFPSIDGDILSFAGSVKNGARMSVRDFGVGVFYDPPPHALTRGQVARTYCYDGGIKIASLREPLTGGWYYSTHEYEYDYQPCPDPYDVSPNAPPARSNADAHALWQEAYDASQNRQTQTIVVPWITADKWSIVGDAFSVEVDIGELLRERGAGVYTITLWGTIDGEDAIVSDYSIFHGAAPPDAYYPR